MKMIATIMTTDPMHLMTTKWNQSLANFLNRTCSPLPTMKIFWKLMKSIWTLACTMQHLSQAKTSSLSPNMSSCCAQSAMLSSATSPTTWTIRRWFTDALLCTAHCASSFSATSVSCASIGVISIPETSEPTMWIPRIRFS